MNATPIFKIKKTIHPCSPNFDAGASPHGPHFWAHTEDD